jgi:exopolyphosphatase/guanosine-5'-triphosphate,3'-diphosphate pyrophosphatase
MNYAVVDFGTNSARLMIAHAEGGKIKSDYKTLRTIRIGEGMVENRGISAAAMERAKNTVNEFKEISKAHKAERFYCFATSAVREAENREPFLDFIKAECGVDIEVISGETEAALGFAGSVGDYGGMFDIGGGSTEVMLGSLKAPRFKHSFRIGTVRCLQLFPGGDDADPAAFRQAHELARETFSTVPDCGGIVFTGIGGTATALVAIDLELKEYSAESVQGHMISLKRARELCRMLESRTKKQREELIGLEKNRADVIAFGAVILLEFMNAAGSEHIMVSDRDNQEGYLAMKLSLLSL